LYSQPIFNIFIFIIIYKPNNFGFAMFWFFKNIIKELNFTNDNDSYWWRWLIYLSMIDEQIISIKFSSNSFNGTCDFNIKTCC
jgi:hypothetical protein